MDTQLTLRLFFRNFDKHLIINQDKYVALTAAPLLSCCQLIRVYTVLFLKVIDSVRLLWGKIWISPLTERKIVFLHRPPRKSNKRSTDYGKRKSP